MSNEFGHQSIDSRDSGNIAMLLHGEVDESAKTPSSPQHVSRQDSGVPEDMASPKEFLEVNEEEEDPNGTINSECNITVIHVTTGNFGNIGCQEAVNEDLSGVQEVQENEGSSRDFTPESKDSKDGSDSGVDGCVNELPRVRYLLNIFY